MQGTFDSATRWKLDFHDRGERDFWTQDVTSNDPYSALRIPAAVLATALLLFANRGPSISSPSCTPDPFYVTPLPCLALGRSTPPLNRLHSKAVVFSSLPLPSTLPSYLPTCFFLCSVCICLSIDPFLRGTTPFQVSLTHRRQLWRSQEEAVSFFHSSCISLANRKIKTSKSSLSPTSSPQPVPSRPYPSEPHEYERPVADQGAGATPRATSIRLYSLAEHGVSSCRGSRRRREASDGQRCGHKHHYDLKSEHPSG